MSSTCISLPYDLNLRNLFYLSQVQQIIIYVLSPFIYLSAIFNIRFFLKGRRKAEPPVDILLFISIFGIIRISSYIASSIFTELYPPSINAEIPTSFNSYCLGTGFVNIMCQIASFVYNVIFGIYYVVKIKNPLKSWIKQHRQLHIFCIFVIIVSALIFYLTDLIGISILGVCGFKIGTGTIFLQFGLTLSYIVVMILSSFFFLVYLRTVSKLDNSTKIYFRFYFKYLLIASITHLLGLTALIVITVKCLVDSTDTLFQVFTIICNLARIISPIIVFFIMLGHPEAKFSSVLRFFYKLTDQEINRMQVNFQIKDSYSQSQSTTKRQSLMIQLKQLNLRHRYNKEGYLSRIKDQNKACLISTILSCLSLQQNQFIQNLTARKSSFIHQKISIKIDELTFQKFNQEELFSWNFSQKYEFELTDDIIQQYQYFFSDKLPSIKLKFTAYNPAVFKKLQRKHNIFNLHQKLLPLNNEKNILNQIQTDGGRSGQFFFFNYDSTLIIKTISDEELNVLLSKMQPYHNYFQKNPNSLIVKIYGVYKVNNFETNQQFSFMLMGNILKDIHKKYVIRAYDMKGSRYQRQVLTNDELNKQGEVQIKKTLKDIDFHTLQGKLYIDKQQSNSLRQCMEDDSVFLCSQGLIDYSLIVIKINYELYLKENDFKEVKNLKIYKSTKQQGVAYVLGIIDYLQTWNIKKKGEKWYKSIFNDKRQISSQNPRYYSQRFMTNLVNVILP